MSYLVSHNTEFGDTRSPDGAPRRICISHIPSNTNVLDIFQLFGKDRVEGVTINNKNPKFVFAFVQFKRPEGKVEALLMNETLFKGRKIMIRNYTDKPKPDHSKARERHRHDFEAREAKPKLEPTRRSSTQHSSRRSHSSSRRRSLSRHRDISPARERPDSSIRHRLGSPIRSRLSGSPRQSHTSARDRTWDFIRRETERSGPSARHSSSRDHNHHRNRSPAESRRRSRSRSRSPAPSLSIASEIYRQAEKNRRSDKSPPKPTNPFALGHPNGVSTDGTFFKGHSTALQTWKSQTEKYSSGLAPATFQVPTSRTAKSATDGGFSTAPKNGFTSTQANGISVNEQAIQATVGNQSTMDGSMLGDMPPDVKVLLGMAINEGTALNLSLSQVNKIIQYFETSRLKLERPSLAMQPVEPYITEPPSVTSGESIDEDELALRVADKFSSINRKIHR